ncbi:MAG: hypothetical protein A3J46_06535 [Candidatus Yanofskybacteria bacterium RIFCSPHIGHO2_02_FULL_41_11]|uniref:Uncharacterized protein n=1 Tax=Candidatus Yanofskybacteria bacterium RIFCSPHIGHO2_02_FULL_41_11 TaxID=1802675 RepID=A0A1F8F6D1_9BACT|nr:MAG: hypothetical protein A3J46_06535 [Candidatus Yanofskybacteria bacterium RIFCSPHIGHO2_02_FULL_41_11]
MAERIYTKDEFLNMWPQAKGELQGLMHSFIGRSIDITAAQLDMAIQLADIEFRRLKNEPRLRVITEDTEKVASPGKVRAVALIDSEMYQVGEDVDTVEQAQSLLSQALRDPSPRLVQVYDDKGQPLIKYS